MQFSELNKIFKDKLGVNHLADIARELGVSPQAVSNWKSRDRVPYKYVQKIRKEFCNLYSRKVSDPIEIMKNSLLLPLAS